MKKGLSEYYDEFIEIFPQLRYAALYSQIQVDENGLEEDHKNILWIISMLAEISETKGQCKHNEVKLIFGNWVSNNPKIEISGKIKKLENNGYIKTDRAKNADRRYQIIKLTSLGEDFIGRLKEDRKKRLKILFSEIDPEAQKSFLNAIIKIAPKILKSCFEELKKHKK